MKEYRSKNSGRYIFNEDIHNLQALALSSTELFRDCGENFVISGCAVSVTVHNGTFTVSVTSGYVWLDGKIRRVEAFTGNVQSLNSIGIYPLDSVGPQITYFNGDSDPQYNEFGAEVRINDDGQHGLQFISAAYSNGAYVFPDVRTAFFGHYALVNNGIVGNYPKIETTHAIADTADFSLLRVNGTDVNDLFICKDGDILGDGAVLTFGLTHLSENSLVLNGTVQAKAGLFSNDVTVNGRVLAGSFAIPGGTSNQFLKADGTVDTINYATSADLSNYLSVSGGTINGAVTIGSGDFTVTNGDIAANKNLTVSKDCSIQRDLNVSGLTTTQAINGTDIVLSGNLQATNITLSGDLQSITAHIGDTSIAGSLGVTGSITAASTIVADGSVSANAFIKNGGTPDQFLKGDGSVDNTVYATASALSEVSGRLANYLPLSGGALTGELVVTQITATMFVKSGGQSDQFLKADGSIDTNSYALASTLNEVRSSLGNYLLLSGGTLTGNLIGQEITANKFVKAGGQANQFLKADGSIDTNTYALASTLNDYATLSALSNYLLLTGGTLSGSITSPSFIKTGGTSSQFLKADGSVDSNAYATVSQLASAISGIDLSGYLPIDGGSISNGDNFLSLQGGGIVIGHLEGQATLALTPIDRNLGISAKALEISCATTIGSSVTANSFIKTGGTSSQFLKADGSVDSNAYVTSTELNDYLPIDGGTIRNDDFYLELQGGGITLGHLEGVAKIYLTPTDRFLGIQAGELDVNCNTAVNGSVTATSFVKQGGTASQFLKADGSIDNRTYLTSSSLKSYVTLTTLNTTLSGYVTGTGLSTILSDYAIISSLNNYMSLETGGTIYSNDDHFVSIRGNGITIGHLEGSVILSVTSIDRYLGISRSTVVSGHVEATAFNTSSDISLKNKLSDVQLSAESIADAPAIKFTWKEGGNKVNVGTVAQYWQEVLPEVVGLSGGHLTMDYSQAAMVSVISLAKEVMALKKEIELLKSN